MRKHAERPSKLTSHIEAPEGYDYMVDFRNGQVKQRKTVYGVPCKMVDSDKRGYKKYELVTGEALYHHKCELPDDVTGKRIQNTLIINDKRFKFVAMHPTASSRLLFSCDEMLQELKTEVDPKIAKILEWTEWQMYRSNQKRLLVRDYSHDKFKSDFAFKLRDIKKQNQASA